MPSPADARRNVRSPFTSGPTPAFAQQSRGLDVAAAPIEHFFADPASLVAHRGTQRIVIVGGEALGGVVEALGVGSLAVGNEVDPWVPVLVAERGALLGLALKSGNFGADDSFAKTVDRIGPHERG